MVLKLEVREFKRAFISSQYSSKQFVADTPTLCHLLVVLVCRLGRKFAI